ncbi:MAG: T9SS type A sorting domain-containing protein, partial [candidate division WOR-3 bacterium]|nr:T9SS type A sorting domain-containing protein [candidate division WOR-3 bacterium]
TVSPVFDYTLGARPLGIFFDYSGILMKPYLTEGKYIMADEQGIYSCNKNTSNYNDTRIDFDSITAYCASDSVISLVKNNGNGTETFIITDLNGNVSDSINSPTASMYIDYLIMIDEYIYFKHNDNEFQTACAIYRIDSLNRLSLIDSFDMNIVDILNYNLVENKLVILDYTGKLTLFNIDDPSVPYILDSVYPSGNHYLPFQYITHYKNMVFIMDDDGGITCYNIKNDSFNYLWKMTKNNSVWYSGVEYCNGYIIQLPYLGKIIEQANLFTFDETGILDSVISYDFNLAFGEAVVESNYIYFPEMGAGYTRVRVGPKKQECIVPDSMHIGSIVAGDSLIYTVPVFNNGDSTLVIDSVISSGHTAVNTGLPVSVSPRDTLDTQFVTYEYASQMSEYIQFYTNDMYDIYNKTIITADQTAGLDSKPERIMRDRNYISISNSIIKLSISGRSAVEYSIFDVTGRMVDHNNTVKQAGTHSINIGKLLKPGVYFVDITAGEMKLSRKIVIID